MMTFSRWLVVACIAIFVTIAATASVMLLKAREEVAATTLQAQSSSARVEQLEGLADRRNTITQDQTRRNQENAHRLDEQVRKGLPHADDPLPDPVRGELCRQVHCAPAN